MITMMCKPITNSCHDKYFQKQGKCIGHLLGGNLSPNNCDPSWTAVTF